MEQRLRKVLSSNWISYHMGVQMVDAQLKKFINWRFVHEVRMLRSVNGFRNQLPEIGKKLGQTQDQYDFLSTVVVVNLLIHARNLKEFFYGSTYSQTAEAKDYVNWKTPDKTSNIEELGNRVNHEIMHMDLGTEEGETYNITVKWKDLNGLVKDLQNVTKTFLRQLETENPTYYEDNLRQLKSDLEEG